ncbi:MAG: hypothetical protein RLZZ528_983 [Pseudomonadota bacterium]
MLPHILALLFAASGPAFAGSDGDAALDDAVTCWEAADWACAFDGFVTAYTRDGAAEKCLADAHHGCGYEILALYQSGIGAAGRVDPEARRGIADKALSLVGVLSEGQIGREGEILFSALRFDACSRTGDTACRNESAGLIELALEATTAVDDTEEMLVAMKNDTGITYPLNLRAVIAEVSATETNE